MSSSCHNPPARSSFSRCRRIAHLYHIHHDSCSSSHTRSRSFPSSVHACRLGFWIDSHTLNRDRGHGLGDDGHDLVKEGSRRGAERWRQRCRWRYGFRVVRGVQTRGGSDFGLKVHQYGILLAGATWCGTYSSRFFSNSCAAYPPASAAPTVINLFSFPNFRPASPASAAPARVAPTSLTLLFDPLRSLP